MGAASVERRLGKTSGLEFNMRVCIQRVRSAQVEVDRRVVGKIGQGQLVLLGVGPQDTPETAVALAEKCVQLRIFEDDAGKMNCSLLDIGGQMLAVSQFTLYGDCRKGRRPSFVAAAAPELGLQLYEAFCEHVSKLAVPVERGVFGADMQVSLVNDGPVTMLLDSERAF